MGNLSKTPPSQKSGTQSMLNKHSLYPLSSFIMVL